MSVVWRIGDLARGMDQYSPRFYKDGATPAPVFRVGESSEAEDWPMLQPGPHNASSGFQNCPATIVFPRPGDGAPAYSLDLHINASKGPCPELEISLNGRKGLLVLNPVREHLTSTLGGPGGGGDIVSVAFPAEWLVEGDNTLVITTVTLDPPDPDEIRPGQPWFTSWYHFASAIDYATVALRSLDGPVDPTPAIRVTPLPLYKETASGDLVELVDVVVTLPLGCGSSRLKLTVGEQELTQFIGPTEFGMARVRFAVPEWTGPVAAEVRLIVDGTVTTSTMELSPVRKWTLHLIPHVHLDLGYTDFQGKVVELHSRNLDRALDILEHTPDYRLSIDGSFVLEQFRASRRPVVVDRVLEALRNGSMSCNAFYVLFMTGIASLEEVRRATDLARELSEAGIRMDYANLTDVPSYSSSLPSILAPLGIDAFLGIQNHGRAGNEDSDAMHMQSPFLWEGPDGARVLTFFADAYSQLRFLAADPPFVSGCAHSFSRFVMRYERPDYIPSDLPVVGINADNEDLAGGEAELVARWSKVYAYPKLRFSTVTEYFDAVRPLRDELPVVRGDGGSYWEDGCGAAAGAMADYRRAQVGMVQAETLGELTAAVSGRYRPNRAELDRGWRSLIIGGEHTWTSWHATSLPDYEHTHEQLDWKLHHIATARRVARDELNRTLGQLGELVTTDGPTLLVVNTLDSPRDGVAEWDITSGSTLLEVDGTEVPYDVLRQQGWLSRVRIPVRNVPACGYKSLRVVVGTTPMEVPPPPGPEPVPDVLETTHYRVTVDTAAGRVVGLMHRMSGRELLDASSPYRLGDVLYVTGAGTAVGTGGPGTSVVNVDRRLPLPDLTITPASLKMEGLRRTPVGWTIVLRGSAPTLPLVETEIELHETSDRVDVRVRLVKEAERAKESVYVAFPFALTEPGLRYDRQIGWVDPATDHLPGACNEWFTTQHAAALVGREGVVEWCSADAPLFTVGDVVRGLWPREFSAQSSTLFSWVMNNHWWTNFPSSQEGDLTLHYAFRPAAEWNPDSATRFGRDVRTPLLVDEVHWLDKADTAERILPAAGKRIQL